MKKSQILDELKKYSLLFQSGIPKDESFEVYAEVLSQLDSKTLDKGFKKLKSISYLKDANGFPSVSKLVEAFDTNEYREDGEDEEEEDEIESDPIEDIFMAAKKYGRFGEAQAREYLGDSKWSAIMLYGGWEKLCKAESAEEKPIKDQLRLILEGLTQAESASEKSVKPRGLK